MPLLVKLWTFLSIATNEIHLWSIAIEIASIYDRVIFFPRSLNCFLRIFHQKGELFEIKMQTNLCIGGTGQLSWNHERNKTDILRETKLLRFEIGRTFYESLEWYTSLVFSENEQYPFLVLSENR